MNQVRQIILDCNLVGESACVLNQNSTRAIQLKDRIGVHQYHYYLQINNHGTDICQLSLTLENKSETEPLLLSSIIFSLIYQQKILFQAPASQLFSQTIKLKTLTAHARDLYRLDWQVNEKITPLRADFDLNFTFDCLPVAEFSPPAQVLGQQTMSNTVLESVTPSSFSWHRLIVSALLVLLAVIFIVLATLLTSSKKGSSHEPEKNY